MYRRRPRARPSHAALPSTSPSILPTCSIIQNYATPLRPTDKARRAAPPDSPALCSHSTERVQRRHTLGQSSTCASVLTSTFSARQIAPEQSAERTGAPRSTWRRNPSTQRGCSRRQGHATHFSSDVEGFGLRGGDVGPGPRAQRPSPVVLLPRTRERELRGTKHASTEDWTLTCRTHSTAPSIRASESLCRLSSQVSTVRCPLASDAACTHTSSLSCRLPWSPHGVWRPASGDMASYDGRLRASERVRRPRRVRRSDDRGTGYQCGVAHASAWRRRAARSVLAFVADSGTTY